MSDLAAIKFPLSAQTCSSLKKRIKGDKKLSFELLKIISSQELIESQINRKQQISYIIQLATAALQNYREFSFCNKLVNSLSCCGLYLESFSILALQATFETSSTSARTPKTPNSQEFKRLMKFRKKALIHPSVILLYFVNVLRTVFGLKIQVDLWDLFDSDCGLRFWLNKLDLVDPDSLASISDHIFRLLYQSLSKSPKEEALLYGT